VIADPSKAQWIHIYGQNFSNTSVVKVNGVDVTSTPEGSTLIIGKLGGGGIANPGNYTITVYTPDGGTSNALNFTVLPPPDTINPSLDWLSPVGNEAVFRVGEETIQLEGSATDNFGVSKVRFYRWNPVTSRWWRWNPRVSSSGSGSIQAR
jgi:hypothetical protein